MGEQHIIPAIIPRSLVRLRETIESLHGVAPEIQIDIVDGICAPEKSWPYRDVSPEEAHSIVQHTRHRDLVPEGMSFELDLMIAHPLVTLADWLALAPTRVVLHLESFENEAQVRGGIEMVRARSARTIIATLNDTPLEHLLALVPHIDGVQCMGIAEIGRQGNAFDERVLTRIHTIRQNYPELSITVDGSVNTDTILLLKRAGADRFVVGSAIFNSDDPVQAYRQLCALVDAL